MEKIRSLSLASVFFAAAFIASPASAFDLGGLVKAGASAAKAATLSDADVKSMADQACTDSDSKNKLAPANSKYTKRLNNVMAGLKDTGIQLNAKVYMTNDINAWAMANGCVRVFSGLMDMMSDDEVRGVLGHEIGHVALGHTKHAMQVAYSTLAARDALATTGGTAATLSQSQLGDLTEKLINAQFSQSQESAADDYSFDLLTKNRANRQALVTAFQKLAQLDGGKSSMFSSHPGSDDRAKHMEERLSKNN